jgi:hypothetical protein
MSWLRKEEWSWWQAGLLLGLLNMTAFYTADHYLAVSTTFSRAAGMAGLLGLSHWAVILPVAVILGGFLFWLDRKGV